MKKDLLNENDAMYITSYATESMKTVAKIIEYLACKGRGKDKLLEMAKDLKELSEGIVLWLETTDEDDEDEEEEYDDEYDCN